jgi:hypothetical protein
VRRLPPLNCDHSLTSRASGGAATLRLASSSVAPVASGYGRSLRPCDPRVSRPGWHDVLASWSRDESGQDMRRLWTQGAAGRARSLRRGERPAGTRSDGPEARPRRVHVPTARLLRAGGLPARVCAHAPADGDGSPGLEHPLRPELGLMTPAATIAGFWDAAKLRQTASSVARVFPDTRTPCVLVWLAFRGQNSAIATAGAICHG